MSILIKGMDMPKENVEYIEIHADGLVCTHKGYKVGRAVSVPTPHGRLIDADILYEKFAELDAQAREHTCKLGEIELNEEWRRWYAIHAERAGFKHDVYDAQTIIEAEE